MNPIIVWLRRDLRIDDNPALYHAAHTGRPVIPLFIVDTGLISRLPSDGALFDFQADALRELQAGISALGGILIVRQGNVTSVHRKIIEECRPSALYFHRDYEPSAVERDEKVRKLYASHAVDVRTFKDSVLQEPHEVLTGEGKPYVVFTPFANRWKLLPQAAPVERPGRFTTPLLRSDPIPGARALKRKTLITQPAFRGGESEARKGWNAFLNGTIGAYQSGRDIPGIPGTSRMSPYLRFGCISVRRLAADCRSLAEGRREDQQRGIHKFMDELIWREFYQAVLFHFPHLLESSYRAEFDRIPWKFNGKQFEAWKDGRTGFPLVDAGMRQLNLTGWMHNRVRMVVASFLTKDMMHDWRLGARYFEEKLMDCETASNTGGWQWSASTGVDPRPLRIFNPRLQSERYDPDGVYIRQYVPELRNVPVKFIHAPHEMTPQEQADCRVIIGRDYPFPVLDHRNAAEEYRQVFAKVKAGVF